jgi:hypothetical protein
MSRLANEARATLLMRKPSWPLKSPDAAGSNFLSSAIAPDTRQRNETRLDALTVGKKPPVVAAA